MESAQFALNPALDTQEIADAFKQHGRVHIRDFLRPEDAERLLASLENSDSWTLVMNQGDRLLELNRFLQADITAEKQAQIDSAIYAAARESFQFRYENIRVPAAGGLRQSVPAALNAFADFLATDASLAFFRSVTGVADIGSVDARATAYGPGHFLTAHNDDADGQSRRVAYVFNLTKRWNSDWGGLLNFPDEPNRRAISFIPAFNAMNLFAVPQPHSVSFVTPFAGARRYSVTGWLHAGAAA